METESEKPKTRLDFYEIVEKEGGTARKPVLEIVPSFRVKRSKDLMIRGKQFYAIWNARTGLWSTDEYDVQRIIDEDLREYKTTTTGFYEEYRRYLGNFSTNSWLQYRNFVAHLDNHYHQLDEKVTFLNSDVKKEDYVTKRLPYDLTPGDISAWDEIVGTLYDKEERAKIEWAIGAVIVGDSKTIQKFLVFYGDPGTGKGTILNIIQILFEGYWEAFNAKELTGSTNAFALEAFKMNPLLGIDHDGDLSRITDNTKFNSMISHEPIQINEKNKPLYTSRFDTFFMMGTNTPVKFTDSRSGLIRRLIDVQPTGNLIGPRKYQSLMNQIKFELGAIAYHCREVYLSMGKDYYSGYRPIEMMLQTDVFFNFIESYYDIFKAQDGITLNQAFEMYKLFIKESDIEYSLPRYKLRDELKSYFNNFEERAVVDGERVRSWFSGFNADRFKTPTGKESEQHMYSLVMEEKESLLDLRYADNLAQYSNSEGNPTLFWDDSERTRYNKQTGEPEKFHPKPDQIAKMTLKELDTTKEHYVKVPENEIVIDFDLTGPDGKKSAERNLEEASKWPPTYAEFSKSGEGIHLHYIWTGGDPALLQQFYDEGIEVKVYRGNSSLRRRLTLCNNVELAELSSGLPLKENKVMNEYLIKDEMHLRALINKALRKEIHPVGTKPNVDYILKVLDEFYQSGRQYDVSDMQNKVLQLAMSSTNQAPAALASLKLMKFASEDRLATLEEVEADGAKEVPDTFKSLRALNIDKEVIFDVEVFPNLFVIVWGYKDSPREENVVMINPTPEEVGKLLSMKLVGYNCRRYDNHMLYAAYQGYTNEELYRQSKKIIDGRPGAYFGSAYNLSYTDILDFASEKKSLKKWEIELGLNHLENNHPWDEPVPKDKWQEIVEYCINDVEATKAVRKHLEADFIARQILADLSGLSMNESTQRHTAKIVFGEDWRNPQGKFKYTDLSEMFPGYVFDKGKSLYREEETGEGGYVYSEPGIYTNVAVLDVASMHPTSIENMEMFGEYTENFAALKKARIAIKRRDFEGAKQMLGGKLARHLNDPSQAKALSYALKIVINIVYGLTSAKFDNAFKDPRNIDNIVAKRGALFMIELKHAVQEKGFQVVHIKTDSIKIPEATEEIIQFVKDFGTKYGYDFEHEETLSKFCLVNKAVYIGQIGWHAEDPSKVGTWEATGAQFAMPYVYKTMFSHEPITFEDLCEIKEVQTSMYLDYTGVEDTPMALTENLGSDFKKFLGKIGKFTPMNPGTGGGYLVRKDKTDEEKYTAVTGTKGWFWLDSEMVKALHLEEEIDKSYFDRKVEDAVDQIKKFTTDKLTYDWFVGAN